MPNQDGVPTLNDLINNAVKSGDEASKNQTALAHLILGNQLGQQTQDRNIKTAQDLADQYSGKGKKVAVNLSGNGGASLSENEPSLISQLNGNQKNQAQAVKQAVDIYQHGLPDVQKRAEAAKEGLDAVNDPKQVGSIGQAKSLMIKNLGMNRYNEQEGNALVPKTAAQQIAGLFNFSGGDNSPLNDAQRSALNQVFMNSVEMAKQKHEMLKKNAFNAYQVSPFFDATRGDQLKQTLGGPVDEMFNTVQNQYKQAPTTNYQPGVTQAQQPGVGDMLKNYLSGIFKRGQQPPQQVRSPLTPQQPQSPLAPQPGAQAGRVPVKTEISPSTGKKRITYSDGSQEIQ